MDWRARTILAASFLAAFASVPSLRAAAQDTARHGTHGAAPPNRRDEDRGAIAGRIVAGADAAGAAGVVVSLSGPPPVLSRSIAATIAGAYRFDDLPAGVYALSFTMAAAVLAERRDVLVIAGVCTRLDVSLDAGPARDGDARAVRSAFGRFTGGVHLRLADQHLQWSNLSADLAGEGAGLGSPIHRVTEAEIEAGGPLLRDRAWLRVSASRETKDVGLIGFFVPACLGADGAPVAGAGNRAECLQPDITTTTAVSAEMEWLWTPAHRTTLEWGVSDRVRPNRGASAYTRPEATTRQSSLSWIQPLRARHQWAASADTTIDADFSYRDTSVVLGFQDPALAGVQGAYDRFTLVRSRSAAESASSRPAWTVALTGATRRDRFIGGSHDIELGVEAAGSTDRRRDRTGGGAVAVFDSRTGVSLPYQARIVRDGATDLGERRLSLFVQDTYERGRLTVGFGLRFDRQDDEAHAATIPANQVLPDLLPAVRFSGADSGIVYHDLSPRVGAAVDVAGDGRTILRAAFARRVGAGNRSSAPLQPTGQTRLVYWWNDANGDRLVDRGELDFARGPAAPPSSNYDAANPSAVRTPAAIDAALMNTVVDEWSVRLERDLARFLSLRVVYRGRNTHRVQRTTPVNAGGSLVSSGTFAPVTWTPANCPPAAECPPVVYFERDELMPAGTLLRNDGEHGRRHALEVSLHKRMARGWMLDASARWEASSWHYPRPTFDYTDPTNVAVRNGAADPAAGPRWVVEVAGTVRLPGNVVVSGLATAEDGLPYERGVTTPNRGALGSTVVDLKRFGSERNPAVARLDVRLERRFAAGRVEVVPSVDVFNLLNGNTVLARNRVQNTPTANAVTRILAPRAIRIRLDVAW